MGIKTFSIDNEIYEKFKEFCKKEGYSMSKKVEKFMKAEMDILVKKESKQSERKSEEHSFSKYC